MGVKRAGLPATLVIKGSQGRPGVVVDLMACRRARYWAVVKGPEFDTDEALAQRVHLSRNTVARFFAGAGGSLATARTIVTALGLEFSEIAHEDDGGSAT